MKYSRFLNVDFIALLLGVMLVVSGLVMLQAEQNEQAGNSQSLLTEDIDRQSVKNFRNENDWIGAYRAVQQQVAEQLNTIKTPIFPWNGNVKVERTSLGSKQNYEVKSYVDITDTRGDSTRVHFSAEVRQEENDNWRVYQLDIDKEG